MLHFCYVVVRYMQWCAMIRGSSRHDTALFADFNLQCHLSVVSQRDYNEATAWLTRGDNLAQRGTRPKFAKTIQNMGIRNGAQRRGKNVTLLLGYQKVTSNFTSVQKVTVIALQLPCSYLGGQPNMYTLNVTTTSNVTHNLCTYTLNLCLE